MPSPMVLRTRCRALRARCPTRLPMLTPPPLRVRQLGCGVEDGREGGVEALADSDMLGPAAKRMRWQLPRQLDTCHQLYRCQAPSAVAERCLTGRPVRPPARAQRRLRPRPRAAASLASLPTPLRPSSRWVVPQQKADGTWQGASRGPAMRVHAWLTSVGGPTKVDGRAWRARWSQPCGCRLSCVRGRRRKVRATACRW